MASRNHKKRRRVFHPFRRASRPGAKPGTIRPPKDAPQTHLTAAVFDVHKSKTHPEVALDQIAGLRAAAASAGDIFWLDVDGTGNGSTIAQIGQEFGLHDLALEDVVNVHQRAKVEEFEHHLFIVARMVAIVDGRVETEQISLFLGERFLLSFQERPGDCLDAVRRRLRTRDSRLRQRGPDFLAHAILDAIVDNYFPVLEYYGDLLDALEERVEQRGGAPADVVRQLHQIRSDLLVLRRAVWPHREMVGSLLRTDHPLMTADTRLFLRDVYDHTVQLLDVTETYREICADLRELHYAQVGQRTNDVMRVLTMISTFFIPLSFITGLYGMNFDTRSPYNMPELHYRFGYPVLLAVMATFAVGMLLFFWRKGWFWRQRS